MRSLFGGTLLAGVGASVCAVAPASAEVQVGFNAGWNRTLSSDVTFTGPNGTDFTLENVPWKGLSFPGDGGAPYYGIRAAYWFREGPGWGVMLDYTHAKVRAKADAVVDLTGSTGPSGVAPGAYPVGDLLDRLEFTDGITFITLNALYRTRPMGRLQPYVGLGAGINRPHVEVTGAALSDLPRTYEFQNGGVTAQALAGVDIRIAGPLSVYGEYRINYSPVDAPLSDDAFEIDTTLFTNQILFGASVHF